MEIVNLTPVPTRLFISKLTVDSARIGMLVAKATFKIDSEHTSLDTQKPFPLFDDDQQTPLGLVPRDDVPRRDSAFEVFLIGAAYAPEPGVLERRVVLTVGKVRRELLVSGDRRWLKVEGQAGISKAQPFVRMPINYTRAFGGSTLVEVDEASFIEVQDVRNPLGRGFDPLPQVEALSGYLSPPPGFPKMDYTRWLPNVEDPTSRVASPGDTPLPCAWDAVPLSSSIQAARSLTLTPDMTGTEMEILPGAYHRAHPDWVIQQPEPGARVLLEGLSGVHERLSFALPKMAVEFDYVSGLRTGRRRLTPHALVLFPDELRFYVVYRHAFEFDAAMEQERTIRVRCSG